MSNYSQDDKEFLTRIAWMYYYGDMSQQSIADRLQINRVKVARLLKRVHQEGIVKIEIESSHLGLYTLEQRLRDLSGLRYAVVVPETKDTANAICRGAAHLLNNLLSPVQRLGIGLSRTLANLSLYVNREKSGISSVVSISGTATPSLALTHHNPGLAVAQSLDVDYYTVFSPIIVPLSTDRAAALNDRFISRVLNMAAESDYILVGIGNVNDSQLMQMGYISEDELYDIQSQGVVGEIIGHYFTGKGELVPTSIDNRIVAVDLPMACPVIGVAGGKDKVEPIVGAILSEYIQGLVTDKNTAESVIERL